MTSAGWRPRRFKPYPAYKDSGVEWLGEIPAHWTSRSALVDRSAVIRTGLEPEAEAGRRHSNDVVGHRSRRCRSVSEFVSIEQKALRSRLGLRAAMKSRRVDFDPSEHARSLGMSGRAARISPKLVARSCTPYDRLKLSSTQPRT